LQGVVVRPSVSRVQALEALVDAGNWNLDGPFTVRGHEIR